MNNKFSKSLLSIALGVGPSVCAFSGQAMAVTTSLGPLPTPSTAGFYDTELTGAFTDNYVFTVGGSSFSSSVTSATLGSLL
jgi:hypothetical protein